MGILLDTSFLIAVNNPKDVNYGNAQAIKARIKNMELGQSYFSDYIFDEFVTFLKAKRVSQEKITEIGEALLLDESIKLLRVDATVFSQSWDLFKKRQALSFTDCTTAILARDFNIKNVASFDADFNSIGFVKRIES